MNTLVSPDSKRAVTLQPAGDEPTITPDTKRRHIVLAASASGALRTWQVSSRDAARKIRKAYVERGLPAVYTVSL